MSQRPNQVLPTADVLVLELSEREALAGVMAVAAVFNICGLSWVIAGFRQNRL